MPGKRSGFHAVIINELMTLKLMLINYKRLYTYSVAFFGFQIAKLQDDNKALDRLTKSKEAALLEAERTVQVALAKASMVDDLQNKNQELMKQIEICQVYWFGMPFIIYVGFGMM